MRLTPRARPWLNWWQRINQVLGFESEQEMPVRRKSWRWRKNACKRGLPRIGKKVMNCGTRIQARGWDVRDTKDGQVITRRAGA